LKIDVRKLFNYTAVLVLAAGVLTWGMHARGADLTITGCDVPQVIVCKASGEPVVPPVVTPQPPPVVALSCPGFAATRVIQAAVPPNGGNNLILNTAKYGGFGANDAVVVSFQAPPADANFGISAVPPSGATGSTHSFVLAAKPCVFDKADPSAVGGSSPTKNSFTVNMHSTPATVLGKYKLTPGVVYYLNLSHKGLCMKEACDLQLMFTNSN
jgi:hypothetical protein